MIPKTYQHVLSLHSLDKEDSDYVFVYNDWELKDWLDHIAFPKRYRKDITGAVVVIHDGELLAMWVTEENASYDVRSLYHPLSYYRPVRWVKRHLPAYWLEDNEYYQKKEKSE